MGFKSKMETFGWVKDKEILLISICNQNGHKVSITNFGAIVHQWHCPDRYGKSSDILLGCRDLKGYQSAHPYFGAIIGRYANRIAFGKFALNGVSYILNSNQPPHHLHGGNSGFDKKIWDFEIEEQADRCTVHLKTLSSHMEEGFPGNLMTKISYTLNDDNELIIDYIASTDAPTVVNLTNHCYFNLTGNQHGNILDHEVCLRADQFTEVDETLIPTGRILPVEGTILDLRKYRKIGDCIESQDPMFSGTKGFDHNYVINDHTPETSVATVRDYQSGRMLEVKTDQPGIQLYTGNWLGNVDGKEGQYTPYAGLCLETQHFPDSPNHSNFPSTVLLPGEKFMSKTVYKISVF
jgi:aldose 1-epimerase